jgi:hypothetical protein
MHARIAAPALLALLLHGGACRPAERTAAEIVADARRVHGSAVLDTAQVRFAFRGDCYRLTPGPNGRTVTRVFRDTVQGETGPLAVPLTESLGPEGVTTRFPRGPLHRPPTDAEKRAVETRLNSVAYFAGLPYNLADPAVRLRRLPDATIRGEPYHSVEVTFEQQGGGRDWEDRFVYWFHRTRHTLDYLAYRYHTDGGGTRFRVATDPRTVGGVRWQDYENYADTTLGARIEAYPEHLGAPTLRRVSDVRLEHVEVGRNGADLLEWCMRVQGW